MSELTALPQLDSGERATLLDAAERTIRVVERARWTTEQWKRNGLSVTPALGRAVRGVFVTLRSEDGELRGCIGTTNGGDPLLLQVSHFAAAAAYEDPRFPPVDAKEIPTLDLHISILGPDRAIHEANEIRIGVDGVWIDHPDGRALFLPEVAVEMNWSAEALLANLCRKGSLPTEAWRDPRARLWAFSTVAFGREESSREADAR